MTYCGVYTDYHTLVSLARSSSVAFWARSFSLFDYFQFNRLTITVAPSILWLDVVDSEVSEARFARRGVLTGFWAGRGRSRVDVGGPFRRPSASLVAGA